MLESAHLPSCRRSLQGRCGGPCFLLSKRKLANKYTLQLLMYWRKSRAPDRPRRNRPHRQIDKRRKDIHPVPKTQRTQVLGKRPMVAVNLFRQRRAHQRGHCEKVHPNTKRTRIKAIPPRPQEAGNPCLKRLERRPARILEHPRQQAMATHLPMGRRNQEGILRVSLAPAALAGDGFSLDVVFLKRPTVCYTDIVHI